MQRAQLHLLFGSLSAVCFVVSTLGFDVVARVAVAGEPWREAASRSLHYMIIQPVGTLMLLLPFIAMAGLSAEVAKTSHSAVATTFFIALAFVLGWLYFSGYWGAQVAMEQHKWTAAALSVGMVPFMSIPVILIAVVSAGVIAWMFRRHEN